MTIFVSIFSVHIKGSSDDKTIEDREVSFALGDGSSAGICNGVEKTISKMKKLELAKLVIQGEKYLPSPSVLQEHGLSVDSTVTYEVELKQFEKVFQFELFFCFIYKITHFFSSSS